MIKKDKVKINSGHYYFLGTDRFNDGEKSFNEDYFKYREKWQEYPVKKTVGEFPLHLDIESTNHCNLKCIMCGRNWMKEKLGFIDWNLYKKIIDEAVKYSLPSVKLNYRGEPLLHGEISKMVKYAKDKGVLEVQLNTNGFLLNEKKAEELISAGIDRIIFSFDAAKKETYQKIRRGSDYDRVVKNIKKLVEIRDKKNLKRPLIRVQMVKMPENEKEIEAFIKMWRPIANRMAVSTYRNPLGEKKKIDHFACPQIWQRLMICWDGEVRMCCGDWYGKIILGNVKKSSLYDIWHSKKLNKIRDLHSGGQFNKVPVCANCEVNTLRTDFELQKLFKKYDKK